MNEDEIAEFLELYHRLTPKRQALMDRFLVRLSLKARPVNDAPVKDSNYTRPALRIFHNTKGA